MSMDVPLLKPALEVSPVAFLHPLIKMLVVGVGSFVEAVKISLHG